MQCGSCDVQTISQLSQILANPATWVVTIAALTTFFSTSKKKKGKK